MFPTDINEITYDYLDSFIKTPNLIEKHYFDFKQEVSKDSLIKSISGFANAGGGWLFIGINEDKANNLFSMVGIPKFGQNGKTKITEQISQIIAENISPFPNHEIGNPISIPNDDEKVVLVIRIMESSNKPHIAKPSNFYLRKGETTQIANLYEIRDMFELSRRYSSDMNFFLHKKNLLDETLLSFGQNINIKSFKNSFSQDFNKNPFLIVSFIPKFVNKNIVPYSNKEFIDWLSNNSKGYTPNENSDLLKILKCRHIPCGDTSNNSVKEVYTNVFTSATGLVIKNFDTDYIEIQNNGYTEYGCQTPIIYPNFEHNNNKHIGIINITKLIEKIWLLINFTIKFHIEFKQSDEIILQISLIDVLGFMLYGNNIYFTGNPFYVAQNESYNTQNQNIKLTYKFLPTANENEIENLLEEISIQIHNSFGLLEDTYFTELPTNSD